MGAIFVTGSDTGVGKTLVTGLLGRFLSEKGYRVITQKWIQSGRGSFPEDIQVHLKLMKLKKRDISKYLSHVSPYIFDFPASPHLSSRLEKRTIRKEKIKKSFKVLNNNFDFVIVEGTGGALVPYNKKNLIIDVAKELKMPVLIVAGNKLGSINHTLLTIESIRGRGMEIAGIIFNNYSKSGNRTILEDNPRIVKTLSGEKVLGTLSWARNREVLYKEFASIAQTMLRNLRGNLRGCGGSRQRL